MIGWYLGAVILAINSIENVLNLKIHCFSKRNLGRSLVDI